MPVENSSSSDFAIASEPFNDPSLADLILRSNDDTDFYVFRGILMFASPVFRDMVTVSDSGDAPAKDDLMKGGLRVVIMHESSAPVLDALLRFLYPMEPPTLDNFHIIRTIASTAKQYEMVHALEGVKRVLRTIGHGDAKSAMGAYFVASSLQWEDLARSFAIETLKYAFDGTECPFNSSHAALEHCWRLFSFRKRVEDRITDSLFGPKVYKTNYSFFCRIDVIDRCNENCVQDKQTSADSWIWLKWRSVILTKLHRAPLADDAVSGKDLREVANRTNCSSCAAKVLGSVDNLVMEFKIEMLRIAQEAELFPRHCSE